MAPVGWYPDLLKPIGKPLGPASKQGTVYTREFEHATAFVDLSDRRKSQVTWTDPSPVRRRLLDAEGLPPEDRRAAAAAAPGNCSDFVHGRELGSSHGFHSEVATVRADGANASHSKRPAALSVVIHKPSFVHFLCVPCRQESAKLATRTPAAKISSL